MGVSTLSSRANYSIYGKDSKDGPGAHWGTTVYWTATTIATLIATLAILNEASEREPVIPLAALLLAGAIWLIGWVCRQLLAG